MSAFALHGHVISLLHNFVPKATTWLCCDLNKPLCMVAPKMPDFLVHAVMIYFTPIRSERLNI